MKILCTICFKKKSYGLKNKNFLKLFNKPLYKYTYDIAKKVNEFENIILLSDGKIDLKNLSKNTLVGDRPKKNVWKVYPKN